MRSMIEWLRMTGSPAPEWVAWARNKARTSYELGIIHPQAYQLGDGTEIRIQMVDENVYIHVLGGGTEFRYQFITTGDTVRQYSAGDFMTSKGSAVTLKLPGLSKPFDVAALTPLATGSLLEEVNGEVSESLGTISRIKNVAQIQLIPEPSYYAGAEFKPANPQILYSWASVPGRIYNAGVYMLAPAFSPSDKFYDLPPTLLKNTSAESRMPDADWPHDACVVTVHSEEFGARRFIVMVDAHSQFYCWPTEYDNAATDYLYLDGSPYLDQAIKTNVADAQVVSLVPPFPSWVYIPSGQRRDTDTPSTVNSGEPRYVWRFHPAGTKVVGIVLKRESLGEKRIYGRTLAVQSVIPFKEVDTGHDLEIDTTLRDATAVLDYSGPIQSDWPGYVEFSLDIAITGAAREAFTFSMTLTRQQAASAARYPIAADYLSPVNGGWEGRADAAVGDLIVMDMASYIDDQSQLWIDREPGYKGSTIDKVRQSWAVIRNEETDTEIRRFLTRDNPENFRVRQYDLNLDTLHSYTGALLHVDLSTLSFVYRARKRQYTVDSTPYMTITGRDYSPYYNNFKVRQRWRGEETGIRYFVFNTQVLEDRGGMDLSLWGDIDAIHLFSNPILFSPLSVAVKWLWSRSIIGGDAYPDRHWLLQYIDSYPYYKGNYYTMLGDVFGDGNNTPHAVMPESQAGNILLKYLAPLSDGTTGDQVYRVSTTVPRGDLVFSANYSSDGSYPAAGSIDFYGYGDDAVYGYEPIPGYLTDIKYRLIEGLQTAGASYFDDILVPWFTEVVNELLGRCSLITVSEQPYTIAVEQGDWATTIGGINYYFCEDYSYSSTYTINEVSATVNPGYSPIFDRYGNHVSTSKIFPKDFFFSGGSYVYDQEEYYRVGINDSGLDHPNLRVYDYPIGAEWMMREWHHAFPLDANFSLCVHPSGYYAGAMIAPCCTAAQPDGLLYSRYVYDQYAYASYSDFYNEPHFNNWAYNHAFGATVAISMFQFTNADATYSHAHLPSAADFGFIEVDTVSRIGQAESTTHAALLESAYSHSFSLPTPTVAVFISSGDYAIRKTIVYDGGTKILDFYDDSLTFYEPRINGSMLFSS